MDFNSCFILNQFSDYTVEVLEFGNLLLQPFMCRLAEWPSSLILRHTKAVCWTRTTTNCPDWECETRDNRPTSVAASSDTHSWRCPAEGAGWPRGSSPHRCCRRSYSAGCRSVSRGANNSHWCSGTCTLQSEDKRGWHQERGEDTFVPFVSFI